MTGLAAGFTPNMLPGFCAGLTGLVGLFGAVLLIRGVVEIKAAGAERNPDVPTD